MVYRPDIQGLRGIAVLAVMIFHLAVGLPGGFVGVDIFFVISGFLMTGIISEEFIRRGTLSFGEFYSRRIRRIFPALLAMILTTTGLGYFLLLPGDYKEFAQSGLYAALSLGNVFFFFSTGYFDIPAETKGLLHTWSLGVEEQFYLIWPPIMIGLLSVAKGRRASMAWLLLCLVGAGFFVSVYGVLAHPKAAFYLLHARLWELAAGGVLVFAPRLRRQWPNELLPAVGLGLILCSSFPLSGHSPAGMRCPPSSELPSSSIPDVRYLPSPAPYPFNHCRSWARSPIHSTCGIGLSSSFGASTVAVRRRRSRTQSSWQALQCSSLSCHGDGSSSLLENRSRSRQPYLSV